jgi:methyl-accepting chemotaxis protein|tara:strand:+ start:4151 stop:6661 length:2511 start_codon:yes stop_codon:yes gene_type:complete
MKGMTISRKLLLIFFVNVLVIGCIAGIVFYSFQGLSGTITYSSKTLGDYKADLDTLRVQQSQLEGLTQPFYLNVTSLSAEKARADFNRFVQKLIFNIEVLHTAKYDSVNALQTHRAAIISETYGVSQSVLKDASNSLAGELDSIEKRINDSLTPMISEITDTAILLAERENRLDAILPQLADSFAQLKSVRSRLMFLYRKKAGLVTGMPAYTDFVNSLMGGEDGHNDGTLETNLFYQLETEINELTSLLVDHDVGSEQEEQTSEPNQTDQNSSATASSVAPGIGFAGFDKKLDQLKSVYGRYVDTNATIGEYVQTVNNPQISAAFVALDQTMREGLETTKDQIVASRARQRLSTQFSSLNASLGKSVESLNRTIEAERQKVSEGILSDGQRFLTILIAIALVGALISLAIGLFVKRSITRPVNSLVEVAQDIAQGEGDLTKRLSTSETGELGELSNWFNSFLSRLSGLIIEIKDFATNIEQASQEIASGNKDLSERTHRQSAALQETASSMEQMNSIIQNSADDARKAYERTQETQTSVNENRNNLLNVVKETIQTNQEMLNNVQETNTRVVKGMADISDNSEKMAGIITLMNDIAFQTNLLALNASIEAARAGEHGKGFAVVATEVRKLASRSSKASEEIGGLVETNLASVSTGQSLVKDGEQSLEDRRLKVETMLGSLQDSSTKNLSHIQQAFRELAEVMENVKTASEEQAKGVSEVNQALTDMERLTQENATLVEENSAASSSMATDTANLAKLLASFRVDRQQTDELEAGNSATPIDPLASEGAPGQEEEELRFYSQPLIEERVKGEYLPAKAVDDNSADLAQIKNKEEPFS